MSTITKIQYLFHDIHCEADRGVDCMDIEEAGDSLKKIMDITQEIAGFIANYDPTPYCSHCGAKTKAACDCGPIAENE